MATTTILVDNISVYVEPKLIGGAMINLVLENTGPATLAIDLILQLIQDVGEGSENITKLQEWHYYDVVNNQKVNCIGSYHMSPSNLNLILTKLNSPYPQKIQFICTAKGGNSEAERTALIKRVETNVIEFSTYAARI